MKICKPSQTVPEENSQKSKQRRGKRKKNNTKQCGLTLYFNNINGYICKKESLLEIVKTIQPDIISLCETKLGKDDGINIEGYECVVSNVKRGQEGLMVAARCGTFTQIEPVSKGSNILVVRIEYPDWTMRVIVCHGPQEDDKQELRSLFFENLAVEIERCNGSDEIPIVLGDLNAKISGDSSYNSSLCSGNGKLLLDLLSEHGLTAANFIKETEGKWTRIQKKKGVLCKSILDYILLEEQLLSRFTSLRIDENKISTPYRITKAKGQLKLTHSDHCALIMTLNCTKGNNKPKSRKVKLWNFTADGFTKFNEVTQETVCMNKTGSIEEVYNSFMQEMEHMLHKCFKKRTICFQEKQSKWSIAKGLVRKILQGEAKKGKVQRKTVQRYLTFLLNKEVLEIERRRAENLKRTADLLTEDDKFSPAGYWKLKKSVSKKPHLKFTSVINKDMIEVTGETMIKNEIKKEFEHRLRNRAPHEEWKRYTDNINQIIDLLLLSDDVVESGAFTMEELLSGIDKLKEGKSPGLDEIPPELFINAGKGLLDAILFIFNKIKEMKTIPDQWNWVSITLIYKNRGSRKELVNYRGIFLTPIITKIFENVLKGRMKENLEKVDKHQAGSRSKRGPPDNLFLLYACRDHQIYKGEPLYVTAYDFEQAFDSLWLQDCLMAMIKLGIPCDILRLVYELNRKAKFKVKTPFGLTEESLIGDIVEQGTVLGATLCSVSTAEYCGVNTGVAVGTAITSSLLFVDDMFDLSFNVEEYLKSHENAIIFGRMKKIPFSKKKCKSMAINGDKDDTIPPLFIEDTILQIVREIVYLGDVINDLGNNDSMMEDRVKRGISAMIRIEALIKETGLGIHTIDVHLLLYRALFVSCMIFNSQAWSNLSEKNITTLEKLQCKCLKKIVNAPQSTANSFTYLEFGVLPLRYEIERNQLVFLHHIIHLEDTDPVKVMWENMRKFPHEANWWSGVQKLLIKYDICLEDVEKLSKESYKNMVKIRITDSAFSALELECHGKKKTENLSYKALKPQEYLSLLYPSQAQTIFKCRSKTLAIKDHQHYKYDNNLCRRCEEEEETIEHIINCGYADKIDSSVVFKMDEEICYDTRLQLILISTRINDFLEEFK